MKMKRLILPLAISIIAVAVFFIVKPHMKDKKQDTFDITFKGKAARSIQGALEYYAMVKGDFETGEIDPVLVSQAYLQADRNKQYRSALNLKWESKGPDNMGGRTRALVVDKDNPNILIAGGVSGGIYKSTDGGITWVRKSYQAGPGGLIVSCINQASDGTIYFGTGEGYFNAMSGPNGDLTSGSRGGGIYKSTDRGETWDTLKSTDPTLAGNSRWLNVQSVKTDPTNPNIVYAATYSGFMKSTDAGASWTRLDMPDGGTIQIFIDIAVSPDGKTIYTASYAAGRCKLFRSRNGDPFTVATTLSQITNTTRLTLAIAPSNPNYVYVCAASNGSSPYPGAHSFGGLYQSKDNGDTWASVIAGGSAIEPFGSNGHYQGQYDNCIAVDPSDPERVFFAGVNLYIYDKGSWYKGASDEEYSDNDQLYKNPYFVHVDMHNIVFDTKSNPKKMYIVTDGGIYSSSNYVNKYPTFKDLNLYYTTTQFYAMAVSSRGDIVGGTQDMGSIKIEYLGLTGNSGRNILGGDGFYSEVSSVNPDIYFVESQYGNLYRSFKAAVGAPGKIVEKMVIPYKTEIDGGTSSQVYYEFNTPFRLWDKLEPKKVDPCCLNSLVLDSCAYYPAGFWTCTFTSSCNLYKCYDKFPINAKIYSSTNVFLSDILVVALDSLTSTKYTMNIDKGFSPKEGMKVILNPQVHVSKFVFASKSGVWMTPNATEESSDTFKWFQISKGLTSQQRIISMELSSDGDVVFVGTRTSSGGSLYRIAGLKDKVLWYDALGNFSPDSFGITTTLIGSWTGRCVAGIGVSPSDDNVVVVALGNYIPNGEHVYISKNALDSSNVTWTSIHKNLPRTPVYDAVINSQSNNQDTIIVATELGIWATTDGGDTWSEENEGMERAPVFMLRQIKKHPWSDAYTIYAASHGMGFFEMNTFVTNSGISEREKVYQPKLSIFPNPAVNHLNMKFIMDKAVDLNGFIYNMNGQIVKSFSITNTSRGENQSWIKLDDLKAGTYIVRLKGIDTDISNRLLIAK